MIETLAFILTGLGLAVSLFYYARVLENANKTQKMQLEARHAQLFMDYREKIMTEPLNSSFAELMNWEWTGYDDFVAKYGIPYWKFDEKKGEKRAEKFVDVFAFFEGMGVLVQTNNVNVELIGRFGGATDIWGKYESIIYELRSRMGNQNAWGEFEELVLAILESDTFSLMSYEMTARKDRRKKLGLSSYENR